MTPPSTPNPVETLRIDGMSCAHCIAAVRAALDAVPGAKVRRVELGTAEVERDPAHARRADLEAAVEGAGYSVVPA